MSTTPAPTGPVLDLPPLDLHVTGRLQVDGSPGGWTVVRLADSGALIGTRKAVKVAGTMDGHPFAATLLPLGGGSHLLPVRAALRQAVGKTDGDDVTIHLDRRFS